MTLPFLFWTTLAGLLVGYLLILLVSAYSRDPVDPRAE